MNNNNVLKDTYKDSKDNLKNSIRHEILAAFKSVIDQNDIPNDFGTWTMKKQYNWINNNISKIFPNVPKSLSDYTLGAFYPLNYDRSSQELPEWFDMVKYRRGQKFVNEHYTAIILCSLLGLIYVYSFEGGLKPVIMGGNGHTPYLGFKKYLSTINRVMNWYNGEPWIKGTKAYIDMQVTRSMHSAIRRKMCQLSNEQIDAATTFANPWCPDREIILKDFTSVCPFEKIGQRPYTLVEKSPYRPKGINNADVAGVQSCFLVLLLCYQKNIGVYDATDEDLEAFCHMWKCYGYFLGLEDKYNFCRGSFEEVKQRTRDFYQYWVIPNFKDISPEWEHMTRCLVEPINYYPIVYMPYKTLILIGTDALNLKMPHLYASLSYVEWIMYKSYKFILSHVLRYSSTRALFNKVIRKILHDASNFSSEKLADIHKKSEKQIPDFSVNMY